MDLIKKNHFYKKFILIILILCLSGCSNGILDPHGEIVKKQYDLIFLSFCMMLLIVIPVIFMTFYFIWKYRESNNTSIYQPYWNHSNKIEFFVWMLPILIIFVLSFVSWKSTHDLDPSKPIHSIYHPIKIEVVALDWKWLFIYPDYNIATINEIAFPVSVPISFNVTSYSVMNSFFIPSLGSQIYAMPGMKNKLNLIANHVGNYKGISSNYSGSGFSDMKFSVIVSEDFKKFHKWINKVKKSKSMLRTFSDFKKIAKADQEYKIEYFSNIMPKFFSKILKFIE